VKGARGEARRVRWFESLMQESEESTYETLGVLSNDDHVYGLSGSSKDLYRHEEKKKVGSAAISGPLVPLRSAAYRLDGSNVSIEVEVLSQSDDGRRVAGHSSRRRAERQGRDVWSVSCSR
jgi:hypothetical protein